MRLGDDVADLRGNVGAGAAPDVDLHLEGRVVYGLTIVGNPADAQVEHEAAVAVAAEDAPLAAAVRVDEFVVAGVEGQIALAQDVLQEAILPFAAERVCAQDELVRVVAVARKQRDHRAAAVDLAIVNIFAHQCQHRRAAVLHRRLLHLEERAVLVVHRVVLALAGLRVGVADGLVARARRRHKDVLDGRLAAGVAGAEDVADDLKLRHRLRGLGESDAREGTLNDQNRRKQ